MLKIFVLMIGVLILFGCADKQAFPTSNLEGIQNAAIGYLQGTVSIGPICPVESVDDPCLPDPSLYTSHKLVIIGSNGETVKQVDINVEGNYRTELASGKYTVDFTPHDIGLPGSFLPPEAVVTEGETTILNIEIDTGIR